MYRYAILLVAMLVCAAPSWAAQMTLATDGQTAYSILVDPDATVAEKHAADELASFLKQITGAEFPIKTGTGVGFMPTIVVGPGKAARALVRNVDFDAMPADSLIMETRSPHLILAGDRPRGTLYAVYSFLEDVCGCRWWTSKASTIPSYPTLSFEERHDYFAPQLEYRETFWWDAFNGDWAARNKSNGHRPLLEEKHGGKTVYGGPFFVHTFNMVAPPETYFKEHPEWFSERGGKRIGADGERTQLCVTNQELKDFAVQQVLKWMAENPSANIVSVSQNDWDNHCLCPTCKALEEEEGSPSGPLLHFINYIAERVAVKYPDVAIDTLAYQYTRKPPKHVKPLPNVIVRLCSIECNFLQPLETDFNETFRDDIKNWSKICDRLYIWDYTTNFAHYIQPHPNVRVLGPNVQFFAENGVKGIFEQGAYQSPGGEMAELKAWVLAKVLWEPQRDTEALVEEFVKGYYGAAAPHILEYIHYLHDDALSTGHNLTIWSGPNAPFLTLKLMAVAEDLFNKAEAAVKDDPEMLSRVQVARLPIRYVWAIRWHELKGAAYREKIEWPGPDSYVENAQTFMDVAKSNGITKLSEGRGIESFAFRTIDLGRTESPVPPGCEKLSRTDYIDLQDATFNLWQEGTRSRLVKDPDASDKVAAMTDGKHYDWAIQQALGSTDLDGKTPYTVYFSARIDKTGDEGKAFTCGVYDVENKVFTETKTIQAKDVKDSKYHTYTITTVPLHEGMYLWVAPAANPDNVTNLYVDRFWLVKQGAK